jgi:hypothetical protein
LGRRIVHSLRCRIFLSKKNFQGNSLNTCILQTEERRGEGRKRRDLLGEVAGRTCEVTKKVLLGCFEREN